jgi:hypothetical protein
MGYWWGSLKERADLENLVLDGKNNITMDLKEIGW